MKKKTSFTAYYFILFVVLICIVLLIVDRFYNIHTHADIYLTSVNENDLELEWDPLLPSILFGLKYFLLALFPISIAFFILFLLSFRDDNK